MTLEFLVGTEYYDVLDIAETEEAIKIKFVRFSNACLYLQVICTSVAANCTRFYVITVLDERCVVIVP